MEKSQKINYHESKFIDQNGLSQSIKVPVVQDLARLGNLPGNFIRNPVRNHPLPPNTSFHVIDMEKLRTRLDSTDRVDEIRKLSRVSTEWGMFTIKNHGLTEMMEDVAKVVKVFFELTFEEKKSSVGAYMSVDNMGYGRNFVKSEDQPLDWIDRLAMKAAPEGASDVGIDVWPKNPADFRPVMEKYVKAARQVLDELLQVLAEAISLDKRAFSQYFDPVTSEINVRINYYPPSPMPDLTLGLTPHTDASVLTLLMQFESSNGLEVFKDNQWIKVPWPCNTLLVNLGDLIEIMSDGRLKSSWHRAVTQSETARFSVALFYNPPAQMEIGPANDEEPIKEYKRVVVGEYVDNLYKISPTAGKEYAMMFAKVN